MQRPTLREFVAPQRARLALVASLLVSPASPEGDLAILVCQQPPVGNRAAAQVAGQVLQDLRGLGVRARRRLDEHHPIALGQRLQPPGERGGILQVRPRAGQLQLAVPVQTLQAGEKLVPKPATEHAMVDQIGLVASTARTSSRLHPTLAVSRGPAAGDHGVDVGMVVQPLIPGVQHQQGRRLAILFHLQHVAEGLPGGVKQQPVGRTAMAQHQRLEFLREREHDLKVRDPRQDQLGRLVQPVGSPTATAQRTVTVAARVVDLTAMVTLRALVGVPAQGRRAAQRQLGQHALHLGNRLCAETLQIRRRVFPQQVDHAERRSGLVGPWSGPGGGFAEESAWPARDDGCVGSAQRGHWRTGSQSSGLGVDSKCGCRTCK